VGGFEFIKWIFTKKSNKRIASAQADIAEIEAETAEFRLLRERLMLADEQLVKKEEQLAKKEERFQEQTELVRDLNRQLLDKANKIGALEAHISRLEAERAMKLCEVRACPKRQPQSGY
jgi:chromosome segregation ATPase